MARRIIQQPQEIILFQEDQITAKLAYTENDEAQTKIDLTGATGIILRVFEFLDDTAALFSITGAVDDGPNGVLSYTFTKVSTDRAAKTYIYTTEFTLSGDTITGNKNQLTIRNKFV